MGLNGEDVEIYPTAIAELPSAEIDRYTWRLSCFGNSDMMGPKPIEALTAAGVRNWTGPCDVSVTVLDRCGSSATAMTSFVLAP
jgi:hypothetical protein